MGLVDDQDVGCLQLRPVHGTTLGHGTTIDLIYRSMFEINSRDTLRDVIPHRYSTISNVRSNFKRARSGAGLAFHKAHYARAARRTSVFVMEEGK